MHWLGLAVVGLVVVHLVLEWRWMVKVAINDRLWLYLATISDGVILTGGLLFALTQNLVGYGMGGEENGSEK
ncbi:MAG: hypothetical protein KKI01_09505 [Proteobacteria bacterium]|nr:hypothetical protein [Pseudomonadota bacterium]